MHLMITLLALVRRKQKPLKVTLTIGNLKPKTSTGIDNISSKLLKLTKDSITESLTIIVNQMLKSGTFPELLKTS